MENHKLILPPPVFYEAGKGGDVGALVNWSVEVGSDVAAGDTIGQWHTLHPSSGRLVELPIVVDRTGVLDAVSVKKGQDVKVGSAVATIQVCSHAVVVHNLCAVCGRDLSGVKAVNTSASNAATRQKPLKRRGRRAPPATSSSSGSSESLPASAQPPLRMIDNGAGTGMHLEAAGVNVDPNKMGVNATSSVSAADSATTATTEAELPIESKDHNGGSSPLERNENEGKESNENGSHSTGGEGAVEYDESGDRMEVEHGIGGGGGGGGDDAFDPEEARKAAATAEHVPAPAEASGSQNDRTHVSVVHGLKGLTTSLDYAKQLEHSRLKRLVADRKLVLVLDLDHTVVHVTHRGDFAHQAAEAGMEFGSFKLGDSPYVYNVRLRPGIHQFLTSMSKLFELHIYTAASPDYARAVQKLLEKRHPGLFGGRVQSSVDDVEPGVAPRQRSRMLSKAVSRLFPCDDSLVIVIDDRPDMWESLDSVIQITPFFFWQEAATPPNPFHPDPERSKSKHSPPLSGGFHSDKGDDALKRLGHLLTAVHGAFYRAIDAAGIKFDDGEGDQKVGLKRRRKKSVSAGISTGGGSDEPAAKRGPASNLPMIKAADEDSDEDGEVYGSGGAKDGASAMDEDLTEPAALSKMEEELMKAEPAVNGGDGGSESVLLEDDVLDGLEGAEVVKVMERVRGNRPGSELLKGIDVKPLLAWRRAKVLEGTSIVLSGVVPRDIPLNKAPVGVITMAFGGHLSENVKPGVTHVVGPMKGTSKMKEGEELGVKLVTTNWLETSVLQWKRVDESEFEF